MTGTDSDPHFKSVLTISDSAKAVGHELSVFSHGGYEDALDKAMSTAEAHLASTQSFDVSQEQQPRKSTVVASVLEAVPRFGGPDLSGRGRQSLRGRQDKRMSHKVVGAAGERFLFDNANPLQKKRVLTVAPPPQHDCVMFDTAGWNERAEEIMNGMENRQHFHPRTKGLMDEIKAVGGYRVRGQASIPSKTAMSGRPPHRSRASLIGSEVQDLIAGVVLSEADQRRAAGMQQDFSTLKLELGIASTNSLKPRGSLRSYFPASSKAALTGSHHPPRLSGALTAR